MSTLSNKISLCGKEYTMKDVSLLRIKMIATKYLKSIGFENVFDWIEDDKKCEEATVTFSKFLSIVLVEEYTGSLLMDIPEEEVTKISKLFFELASAQVTAKS